MSRPLFQPPPGSGWWNPIGLLPVALQRDAARWELAMLASDDCDMLAALDAGVIRTTVETMIARVGGSAVLS